MVSQQPRAGRGPVEPTLSRHSQRRDDLYGVPEQTNLSSEDSSGLHTPSAHTPSPAFSVLPNTLPPISAPLLVNTDPEASQTLLLYRDSQNRSLYQQDALATQNERHTPLPSLQRLCRTHPGTFPHDMAPRIQTRDIYPPPHIGSPLTASTSNSPMFISDPSQATGTLPISSGPSDRSQSPKMSSSVPAKRRMSTPLPSQEQSQDRALAKEEGWLAGESLPESSTSAGPRTVRSTSSQVIACRQCRSRKIRCDSTRPKCNNCARRSSTCEYDAAPKRRGPDKRPGTRQRTCKKKSVDTSQSPNKRRRGEATASRLDTTAPSPPTKLTISTTSISSHPMMSPLHLHSQSPASAATTSALPLYPPATIPSPAPPTSLETPKSWSRTLKTPSLDYTPYIPYNPSNNLSGDSQHSSNNHVMFDLGPKPHLMGVPPPSHPSREYSRRIWWDEFLNSYSPHQTEALQIIVEDLNLLFSSTGYWLACFNVPLLFHNLYDPGERGEMEPSLVLSALALATLMKSSEIGLGESGRTRALQLRDLAQASLEASLNSQLIDSTLGQAALMLALFEASAHPSHSSQKAAQSLMYLDSIIRRLGLTTMDAGDPAASVFYPKSVPAIPRVGHSGDSRSCLCENSPFLASSPNLHAPGWDTEWTVAEIRREESRRLCWSALTLVAAHTADCAVVRRKPLELQLIKPSNYVLLFPGEALYKSQSSRAPHPPKETVWALYCRSMLLWNSCLELTQEGVLDSEKAEFALQAWMEADIIEDALNCHTCSAEQSSLFVGRDYLLNTRMTITQEFRRYVPLSTPNPFFSRKKAEDWLNYQHGVAQRVKSTLHILSEGPGKMLTTRPFYVWWFMGQIAISMSLWSYDPALTQALKICHEFLAPIDVLTYLWPCPAQRIRYQALRDKLTEASVAAGLEPPPSPHFSLPSRPLI